jgi:hypothetical protein
MERMLVVCGNKEHLNELVSIINRRGASMFTTESLVKTSDLNGETACDVDVHLILLSLAGKADAPWDLWVLRHRFPCAKIIVEMDDNATQERHYKMLLWGAFDTFTRDENVWDVISRINSL